MKLIYKVLIGAALLALASFPAFSATRDHVVQWVPPSETVEGDLLDQDGDGVPELLRGYRLYDVDGNLIQDIPDNMAQLYQLRMNFPWGETCFKMTAYNDYGESAYSNIGACIDVQPGKPKAPTVLDIE